MDRVTDQQGVQLGVGAHVSNGPDGGLWLGLTLTMGPSSYTVGIPVGMTDTFLTHLETVVRGAVQEAMEKNGKKLVLPNDIGSLIVPKNN